MEDTTHGKTILFVEDSTSLSAGIKGALERFGYPVLTASSGEKALAIVESGPKVDLVLMDIGLGNGMDGTVTASKILEHHDLPIIFLSSHTEPEIVEKTAAVSSYGFVLKSAGISVLQTTIKMALRLYDANKALEQSEKHLLERETLLNMSQKLSKTGGWEYYLDTKQLRWTEETYRIHGISPDNASMDSSELIEKSLACYDPSGRERVRNAFLKCVEEGTPYDIEVGFTNTDGRAMWMRTYGEPVWEEGRIVKVIGNIIDITERKEVEQKLRESEQAVRKKLDALLSPEDDIGSLSLSDIIDADSIQSLMNDFFNLTEIGVAVIDNDGKVLVATGWQDICTKFHRVHPETNKHCIESDTMLGGGGEPGTYKIYKCKNNMWDISSPIIIGDKQIGSIFLGQFFFEDEKPDYETFKQQARRYGFDEKEYLAALDRVPRWTRRTIDHVMCFYSKFAELISKLGYSNLKLARTAEKHKQAETKIQHLLQEKEMILKEVHHRIKNNFSTISSLLNLQIQQIDEEAAKDALRDAAGRVSSMMLLYEELYRSERVEGISIKAYLPPLIDEIIRIFPESIPVTIHSEIEDIILSPKTVTTLGIIINELVTNAVKYAFTGVSAGEITVTICREDGGLTIVFRDNGKGLPDRVNLTSSPGFGLQLITLLVEQLDGDVHVDLEKGTTFTITLPPETQ